MEAAPDRANEEPAPSSAAPDDARRGPWLVRRREDWRQVGIVLLYLALLLGMVFVPAMRHPLPFVLACGLSFLNAVVIHNHMHKGVFQSKRLNDVWRWVISFGALYPASANIPGHNLVHHHFEDEGQPDWVDPHIVSFRWNLLNMLHFPNVAGPRTFDGVQRWAQTTKYPNFSRQYAVELAFAFGITGALLIYDFWGALLFVVVPQLWGARGILRINLIQHDGCATQTEWNHSRNFVGRAFNWVMCNNGYHTIHHNRPGVHWADLPALHQREVVPQMDPRLDEPSMLGYLFRTYVWPGLRARDPVLPTGVGAWQPAPAGAAWVGGSAHPGATATNSSDAPAVASRDAASSVSVPLASREERREAAFADSLREAQGA